MSTAPIPIKVGGRSAAPELGEVFNAKERIRQTQTPELVIALCGPLGTPLHRVSDAIKDLLLRTYKYEHVDVIKLSDFIRQYGNPRDPEDITALIDAGNDLRKSFSMSVLAQLAIKKIALCRAATLPPAPPDGQMTLDAVDLPTVEAIQPTPVVRHCHIIDSIKNIEELEHFRMVYGRLLHVISVYSPLDVRTQELTKKLGGDLSKVYSLIDRDSGEESKHGQSVKDIFPQADFFLRVNEGTDAQIETSLHRYLDLLLGEKVVTPTPAERAMYEAHSAARNSACLSRQVGAAITDGNGQVLAVGWNDVPRAFGGLYESAPWIADASYVDHRCWQKEGGKCFNDEEKDHIAQKLTDALVKEKIITDEQAASAQRRLRHSSELRGLIEFSRAVHAEMHALLNAGQVAGARIRGGRLYVTTYPCHSCARHIIASGIREVCFIEPYRKSLAVKLHSDAITESESDEKKVRIVPFDGVAPTRFLDLFSEPPVGRKDPNTGKLRKKIHLSPPVTAVTLEAVTTLENLTLRELESMNLQVDR